EWWSQLVSDVNALAKKYQLHSCRAVCHKYGSSECRFQFPHEIVLNSKFDAETNSFFLRALNPLVNWFNPEMMICTRHNHDLKCILSGKAAKAAMFYITNYITKFDQRTYQILSLL
ncbi:hypothetical protein C8F01DRAFT_960494, partial [Mycena amicta]